MGQGNMAMLETRSVESSERPAGPAFSHMKKPRVEFDPYMTQAPAAHMHNPYKSSLRSSEQEPLLEPSAQSLSRVCSNAQPAVHAQFSRISAAP